MLFFKKGKLGTFLAGQVVKTLSFSLQGLWVQSLVSELRSDMPGAARNKKKREKIKQRIMSRTQTGRGQITK